MLVAVLDLHVNSTVLCNDTLWPAARALVEVPEGVAEETIAALSGTSFKGRRITVDFARSKS